MTSDTAQPIAARATSLRAVRRSLFWRIHFWAALLASPFALAAAVPGLLYALTPQIEQALHGSLDHVAPLPARRSLDDSVKAAQKAAPSGWTLHSVVPPHGPTETLKVAFMPPAGDRAPAMHGHDHGASIPGPVPQTENRAAAPTGAQLHGAGQNRVAAAGASGMTDGGRLAVNQSTRKDGERPETAGFLRGSFGIPGRALVIYVDPFRAEVVGRLPQSERFREWSRKLHSTYLLDGWRWMIELAASWLMVMLLTGVYLWWPQPGQSGLPQLGTRGRPGWKQWHAFLGVAASAMSAIMLLTGLTWSKYAGDQVRWARDAVGQAPPRIPAHFKSTPIAGGQLLDWEGAWRAIRREAPDVQTQVMPPAGPTGYWRANQIDRGQPERRFDLLLDAWSGQRLYYSGWDQQTAFGKATAIGIPFHRGEFGLWNQALLILFGLGVIFSLISGWVMYLKRRALGRTGLPPVLPGAWRRLPLWSWLLAALLLTAMPLLAVSALGVVTVEAWLRWRRPSPAGS